MLLKCGSINKHLLFIIFAIICYIIRDQSFKMYTGDKNEKPRVKDTNGRILIECILLSLGESLAIFIRIYLNFAFKKKYKKDFYYDKNSDKEGQKFKVEEKEVKKSQKITELTIIAFSIPLAISSLFAHIFNNSLNASNLLNVYNQKIISKIGHYVSFFLALYLLGAKLALFLYLLF